MIYHKLPIILLTEIASLSKDDINCSIAQTILKQLDSIVNITITELANQCNVSISSISRFCRKIGLSDFSELKELINSERPSFEIASSFELFSERAVDHAQQISKSIKEVAESINYQDIEKITKDIDRYQNVTVLGLLKASSAALNLQADCLLLGKIIHTKLAYSEQIDFLNNANHNDLVIVFSYTGTYFSEGIRAYRDLNNKPKIYLISGDKHNLPNDYFETIRFSSPQTQIAHPYQLIFISSLIAQEYQRLVQSKR